MQMKKSYFILTFLLLLWVTGFAAAQNVFVKGTVTDAATGDPFPFVSIQVKGTSNGTTTQEDGTYALSCPANAILIYSFVGYKTQEVELAGRGLVNVILAPDTETLEDVLVVAYGTAKKSSYSGSAAMVRSEELVKNPTSSFEQAMQGKVAGLQVTTSSGQPGAATTFRIRGSGSLNASNEPLYVIDGVATTNGNYSVVADDNDSSSSILASINPQDIESVSVLKDAAAASLYGSRAANGVVIITTKSGKTGDGKLNLNIQYGISNVPKFFDLMDSQQFYGMLYRSYLETGSGQGLTGNALSSWANQQTQGAITFNPFNVDQPFDATGSLVSGARTTVNTDWQREVLKRGSTQDYNLSYSGGTNKIHYFFSGGYYDQKGTAPTARFTRYSAKSNIEADIKPWLKAGMNTILSYSVQNTERAEAAGASPLYNALLFPNGVPIYLTDHTTGSYILDEAGEKQFNWTNPVSRDFNPLAIPFMNINRTKSYRLLTSFFTEIKFMEGLNLKTTFSPDYVNLYETKFWNKEHGDGPAYGGRSERHQTHDLMYTSTTTLNFNRTFGDKHNVSALAGYEFWHSTFEYVTAQGTNFAFDFMNELIAAASSLSPSSWTTEASLISWLGHAEYNFDQRYYLSGSFRRDGSSVFGAGNKWGNFFSVAGSWRISAEPFMESVNWLSNLKLRASYGTSGNNAGVGRYQSLGTWGADKYYNYGPYSGFGHTQLSNPALQWEKQRMLNIGLDFGFLDDRITGSVEVFRKTSDGLLYNFPLPTSHGISSIMMNLAQVQNQGVEFEVTADVVRTRDFTWNVGFNFSASGDKILDLAGDDDITMSTTKKIWKVGCSQYEFYMPTWAGVDKSNGAPLWKKGDGTTDQYALADWERQGRATPWGFGSLTNAFSWKGLSLSAMLYYNLGGKVYDGLYAMVMHEGSSAGNLHVDELDAWTPQHTDTNVPKYENKNASQSNSVSSRFLYDATYLKLKNVNLSYTLPKRLVSKLGPVSGIRAYFNVDNLATWFKDKDYRGYDDIDIFGIQGYATYPNYMPLSRTYTFGINLTF